MIVTHFDQSAIHVLSVGSFLNIELSFFMTLVLVYSGLRCSVSRVRFFFKIHGWCWWSWM